MKLRNYQTSAVEAVFEAWQKFKRVLVVLPTGCGKTVVFASVIRRLLDGTQMAFGHTQNFAKSDVPTPVSLREPTARSAFREVPSVACDETATDSSLADGGIPPGVGKPNRSQSACHEVTCVQKPQNRVLVLAHREELITQAKEKIEQIVPSADVQIEMAEFKVTDYFGKKANVVVSTVQTQCAGPDGAKRMDKFKPEEFAAVIVDEAHHATAATYRQCLDHYCENENCRVLGVTATPDRADETALGAVFDTVAFEYTVSDAIEDGWLVPVRQQLVKVESLDFSGVSTSAGDLNSAELAEVMEDERNLHGIVAPTVEILARRSLGEGGCRGKRTILFAASVKQAERICEIINRGGTLRADWVCGMTPKDERRRKLAAFKAGEIDIICNVGVLTEGFDDAGVEVVVMARPTKSRALYAQMAGRATRPAAEIADKLGEVGTQMAFGHTQNFAKSDVPTPVSLREPTARSAFREVPSGACDETATDSSLADGGIPPGVGKPNRSQSACHEVTCVQKSDAQLRREMIAGSSKPSCLIVDFVGNSGRHKLVTTVDILGGKDVDDEEVRTRARKIVEESGGDKDTSEALKEARAEIEARKAAEARRRAFVQASAKYVRIDVDPLNVYDLPPVEQAGAANGRPLSLKQEMILRTRLKVDPEKLGAIRSRQLLNEFFRRFNYGLASLPQTRLLKRFGIEVPLKRDEAKRVLDRCMAR